MLKARTIAIKDELDKIAGLSFVFGRTFYVMKSTETRYEEFVRNNGAYIDGVAKVYTSVLNAVAAAKDYDQIVINPGVYDEGAVINVTQAGLKLIGTNTSGIEWGPCSLKASAAVHDIISVQANGVEIANLGFIQNTASKGVTIDHSAAVYKTHIHDCHFGGSATATYGVYAGETFDAVDTVIEDCEFLSWATAAIRLNGTRCKARKNLIFGIDSSIGIELVPTTGDRPYSLIDENIIIGTGTTDTGIKITGSPSKGMYMISRNYIGGCATTITQKANNAYCSINNYVADGAGGALIDTVA